MSSLLRLNYLPSLLCSIAVLAALPAIGLRAVAGPIRSTALTAPGKDGVKPAFLLFNLKASGMERDFVRTLPLGQVRVVSLSGLDSREATEYGIRETPTLVRLTPAGTEKSRYVGASAITGELARAETAAPATCPTTRVARLKWVEEADRRATWVYRRFNGGRDSVPDIYKAMSMRPELMEKVLDLSEQAHFSDGFLDHRTKERIATLVSSVNRSNYCTSSHAAGLRDLGGTTTETLALIKGDIEKTKLSAKQQALLTFAQRLTRDPGANVDQDIQRLRKLGWRDEQIFEAAFDTALFNFFNRIAATYKLPAPTDGWKPELVQAKADR